jgi:hypothetical protein
VRFPEKNLSIVALSNDEHINIFQTGLTIAGYYLKNDLKARASVETLAPANEKKGAPAEINNDLRDFEGEFYSDELSAAFSIRASNGKLIISQTRLSDVELIANGRDKFSGRLEFPVEVEFLRSGNGSVTGFKISNFGAKNVKFEKVK